jgi:signal transduction histidine kinase
MALAAWTARALRLPLGGSLLARLYLLVALCVLPLLTVTLAANYLEYLAASDAASAEALGFATAFADDVARELNADIASLQALALSSAIAEGRMDTLRKEMEAFLALQSPGTTLALIDAAGRRVLATPGALMEPPPEEAALRAQLFGSGQPAVSARQAVTLGGRPGFCIGVPVWIDGQVRYALLLAPDIDVLTRIAAQQPPQPGWTLTITDSAGIMLSRWPHPQRFIGRPVAADLFAAMRRGDRGVLPTTTQEGQRVLAAFARVEDGFWLADAWHVAVGIPRRELEAPLWRATTLALGAGMVLLIGGLWLARVVAHGITGPIARLQALAADPDGAPPPPTGLPEADLVAKALHAAAAARHEALARAQALADTLEHRVAEEVAAREAVQARAAQGERMQALGWLASGVAHDFNNVLQAVENAATRLALRGGDSPEVTRAVRLLRDAVRHGAAITGRLLGFARREALAPAPLDLGPLLLDLAEMLTATLKADVRLEVDAPEGLPRVLADRGRLETVLINLAANARDAMPQGGSLIFSAVETPAPPCLAEKGGRYVLITVADTGVGMTPEVLARVTEPFFTTKPPGKGTGLGLSLARSFAEQSGGALAIDSTPGAGTRVRIWLPAAV